MKRDPRPVKEQVKSGLVVSAKILAGTVIAGVYMAGFAMVREAPSGDWLHRAMGWLLLTACVSTMTMTIRFWAAGFVGAVGYGAMRSSVGVLFAGSLHISRSYIASIAVSFFVMTFLIFRFSHKRNDIRLLDRLSLVFAASCVLTFFQLLDSNKAIVVLNTGNLVLFFSWWAARRPT